MYKKLSKFSILSFVCAVSFFCSITSAYANTPAPTLKIRPGEHSKGISSSSEMRWYDKGEKVYIHLYEVGTNPATVQADVRYDVNTDLSTYNGEVKTIKVNHGSVSSYFYAPASGYYYGYLWCYNSGEPYNGCSANFDMDDEN